MFPIERIVASVGGCDSTEWSDKRGVQYEYEVRESTGNNGDRTVPSYYGTRTRSYSTVVPTSRCT